MAEAMTGREYYIQRGYDELPEAVRKEMCRVFDTGVNNSGVWVRFKEVENLAGIMAHEYTHRPVRTNADRIRSLSDEELAEWLYVWGGGAPNCDKELGTIDYKRCADCWLDWLKSPVEETENG